MGVALGAAHRRFDQYRPDLHSRGRAVILCRHPILVRVGAIVRSHPTRGKPLKTRALIIDDDETLAEMLSEYLGGRDFEVVARHRAGAGLEALADESFDAVILDVMLPDLDGFEVCKRIREHSNIPILMLTARGDETDRIVGLEIGADDYLPKPFSPRELLARLRAVLRRTTRKEDSSAGVLRFGRLEIDRGARVVSIDGDLRSLTNHQFELLLVLAENAGRVLSRDQLMLNLRGHSVEAFDRSIDNHISRIRGAIEDDPKKPRRLLTVRGAGYVLARSQDGDPGA
jgi:two-component system phosphate regulon response regulator OmpR